MKLVNSLPKCVASTHSKDLQNSLNYFPSCLKPQAVEDPFESINHLLEHVSSLSRLQLNGELLEDFTTPYRTPLIMILKATHSILNSCSGRHKQNYYSQEHLLSLLVSVDPEVVTLALQVMYASQHVSKDIRVLSLSRAWGDKEQGFDLECYLSTDIFNPEVSAMGPVVYFEFFHPTNGFQRIHIGKVEEDTLKIFNRLIQQFDVPLDARFELLTRIRFAKAFQDPCTRKQHVCVRLLALSVFHMSSRRGDIWKMLKTLVFNGESSLEDVQTLALCALSNYMKHFSRGFLSEEEKQGFKGMAQKAVASFTQEYEEHSEEYIQALLRFSRYVEPEEKLAVPLPLKKKHRSLLGILMKGDTLNSTVLKQQLRQEIHEFVSCIENEKLEQKRCLLIQLLSLLGFGALEPHLLVTIFRNGDRFGEEMFQLAVEELIALGDKKHHLGMDVYEAFMEAAADGLIRVYRHLKGSKEVNQVVMQDSFWRLESEIFLGIARVDTGLSSSFVDIFIEVATNASSFGLQRLQEFIWLDDGYASMFIEKGGVQALLKVPQMATVDIFREYPDAHLPRLESEIVKELKEALRMEDTDISRLCVILACLAKVHRWEEPLEDELMKEINIVYRDFTWRICLETNSEEEVLQLVGAMEDFYGMCASDAYNMLVMEDLTFEAAEVQQPLVKCEYLRRVVGIGRHTLAKGLLQAEETLDKFFNTLRAVSEWSLQVDHAPPLDSFFLVLADLLSGLNGGGGYDGMFVKKTKLTIFEVVFPLVNSGRFLQTCAKYVDKVELVFQKLFQDNPTADEIIPLPRLTEMKDLLLSLVGVSETLVETMWKRSIGSQGEELVALVSTLTPDLEAPSVSALLALLVSVDTAAQAVACESSLVGRILDLLGTSSEEGMVKSLATVLDAVLAEKKQKVNPFVQNMDLEEEQARVVSWCVGLLKCSKKKELMQHAYRFCVRLTQSSHRAAEEFRTLGGVSTLINSEAQVYMYKIMKNLLGYLDLKRMMVSSIQVLLKDHKQVSPELFLRQLCPLLVKHPKLFLQVAQVICCLKLQGDDKLVVLKNESRPEDIIVPSQHFSLVCDQIIEVLTWKLDNDDSAVPFALKTWMKLVGDYPALLDMLLEHNMCLLERIFAWYLAHTGHENVFGSLLRMATSRRPDTIYALMNCVGPSSTERAHRLFKLLLESGVELDGGVMKSLLKILSTVDLDDPLSKEIVDMFLRLDTSRESDNTGHESEDESFSHDEMEDCCNDNRMEGDETEYELDDANEKESEYEDQVLRFYEEVSEVLVSTFLEHIDGVESPNVSDDMVLPFPSAHDHVNPPAASQEHGVSDVQDELVDRVDSFASSGGRQQDLVADNIAFFYSLGEDLRRELLSTCEPQFLSSLPPELLMEAGVAEEAPMYEEREEKVFVCDGNFAVDEEDLKILTKLLWFAKPFHIGRLYGLLKKLPKSPSMQISLLKILLSMLRPENGMRIYGCAANGLFARYFDGVPRFVLKRVTHVLTELAKTCESLRTSTVLTQGEKEMDAPLVFLLTLLGKPVAADKESMLLSFLSEVTKNLPKTALRIPTRCFHNLCRILHESNWTRVHDIVDGLVSMNAHNLTPFKQHLVDLILEEWVVSEINLISEELVVSHIQSSLTWGGAHFLRLLELLDHMVSTNGLAFPKELSALLRPMWEHLRNCIQQVHGSECYAKNQRKDEELLRYVVLLLTICPGEFSTCPDIKKIFNEVLQEYPYKMLQPHNLVKRFPRWVELDNKRSYIRLVTRQEGDGGIRNLNVRRNYILQDSCVQVMATSAEEFKRKLKVTFRGEHGADVGGLTREWFELVSSAFLNGSFLLFSTVLGGNSGYQPNPNSKYQFDSNASQMSYFKFAGRVVAKAICEERLLNMHFTTSFYKHILGKAVTYCDIENIDPDFYKSLVWILENNVGELELTFSADADDINHILYGERELHELIPGGRGIKVTEENKRDYVNRVAEHRLTDSIRLQIQSFLEGFYELIPQDIISILDHKELELVINGLPNVDVDDLMANTFYEGYEETSQVIRWFWDVVKSLSEEDKAHLLQFTTGSSKVPLGGFQNLQGSRLVIRKMNGSHQLPCAHTCFSQLDLPDYSSKEQLEKQLLTAIREGNQGFAFA